MNYKQIEKKYGATKVNEARDIWYSNFDIRVRGTLATLEVKGSVHKLYACLEMIIKGELV